MADTPQAVQTPDNLAMLQSLLAQRRPMQPDPTPSMIGTLPGVGQPSPAPAAPAAGPIGPTSPFDMRANIESVLKIPEVQAMFSNLGGIQQQIGNEQMRGRALATPEGQVVPGTGEGGAPGLAGAMPKMQFSPDMHGSLLHKIGQALLSVGAATGPGQAIQDQVYGQSRRSWGAQREANVQALADLKAQLGVPTEELKAVSGLGQGVGLNAYRGGIIADRQQKTEIARVNSQTKATQVANQQVNSLQRIAQGWSRLTIDQQRANADSAFKAAIVPIYQARVDAGMDENEARIQAMEDIRAAGANNSYIQTHPVLSAIFGVPGGLAQAPPAQTTPLNKTTPTTPKKKGGGSTKIVVRPEDMK